MNVLDFFQKTCKAPVRGLSKEKDNTKKALYRKAYWTLWRRLGGHFETKAAKIAPRKANALKQPREDLVHDSHCVSHVGP